LALLATACAFVAPSLATGQATVQVLGTAALNSSRGIAVDANNVYVTAYGATGVESRVFSMPVSGGTVSQIYAYIGADGLDTNDYGIASDGHTIYWADPNSGPLTDTQVFSAPANGSGPITPIYTGAYEGQPIFDGQGVLIHNGELYISDELGGRIFTMSENGAGITQITDYAPGVGYEVDPFIAVLGNKIYEAYKAGATSYIESISDTGGGFTTLYSAPSSTFDPRGLAAGNGTLYCGNGDEILQMSIGGGTPTELVGGASLGNETVSDLAYYGGSLYVVNDTSILKVTPVPEPFTFLTLGLGGLALAIRRRTRR
jgi:hypothetical protein